MLRRISTLIVLLLLVSAAAVGLAGCGSSGDSVETTVNTGPPGSPGEGTGSTGPATSELPPSSATSTTGAATTSTKPTETTARPATTATAPTSTAPTTKPGLPATNYTRLPTEEKVVALTFDAAYDPAPLADILRALEAADARATFFLTGEFVRDFPDDTKKIIAGGYPVGNHSYTHPDFTGVSDATVRDEVRKTAAAIEKVGGRDPRPLFRAPFGALNDRVLRLVGEEGYVSVYWTIDTIDWKPERTTTQIKETVLGKLQPGAIVLMHVGSKQTAQILPELLEEISKRGYRFVGLREALPEAR